MATKKASLGVAPKKDLELSFASVAYATIRDKVPRLVQDNALRGFQLLDKSDDNKKAAGVFGAKIGDRWFYMPSFFVRNELKGSELLFTDKIFTPLSEAWVNYFLTKTGLEVGSGRSFQQPRDRFASDPSTDQVIYGRKLGEFLDIDNIHDFSFFEAAGDAYEKNLSQIKVASADDVLRAISRPGGVTLEWLATSSPSAFCQLRKLAVTRPVIRKWLFKQYGDNCLQKWAAAHIPAKPLKTMLKQATLTVAQARAHADLDPIKTGSLRVVRYETFKMEATPGTLDSDVDVAKRNRLAAEGEIIDDERSDDQVSVAVVDMTRKIGNPSSPGVYNVITTEGVKKCYVLPRPCSALTIDDPQGKLWLVVEKESKRFIPAPANGIFVEGEKIEPASAIYDAASKSRPSGESLFVLVTPNCEVSQPVVRESGDSGTLKISQPSSYRLGRTQIPPSAPATITPESAIRDRSQIASTNVYIAADAMVDRDVLKAQRRNEEHPQYGMYPVVFDGTDNPRVAGGVIRVPKETRYLTLSEELPGYSLIQSPNDFARKVAGEGAHRVSVTVAGGRYPDYVVRINEVESYRGSKVADVRLHLMAKQAFRQDDADELIKLARTESLATAWVAYPARLERLIGAESIKVAFGLPDMGPPFPQLPEDSLQLGRGSVRMLDNGLMQELVPEREKNRAPEHDDPYLRYRAEDFQSASPQQLNPMEQAMSDEKDIESGTRLLQLLLQNTSIEREIRLAAKKAMEALNQYGKLLYSIYWRYEDFEEVFGEDRMPEVEDSIRNTFDSNGKVALQLSERVQNQSMTDLQDIDLASLADS